jgi:hypothetical protein
MASPHDYDKTEFTRELYVSSGERAAVALKVQSKRPSTKQNPTGVNRQGCLNEYSRTPLQLTTMLTME